MTIQKTALCIAIISFAISISIFASPVELSQAEQVADFHVKNSPVFYYEISNSPNIDEFSIKEIISLVDRENSQVLAYIATLAPRGYVVVSSNTDIHPVIAYSGKDNFSFSRDPQNKLLSILEFDMAMRIEALQITDSKVILENNLLWERYLDHSKVLAQTMATSEIIGPWIQTNWGQGTPYNTFCPMDPETGERCVTGCVATAMAQIVDYWEWPPSVELPSSDSYYSNGTTPRIWIDATTATMDTIIYNSVGGNPTSETIAGIMFACGVSVRMSYSSEGSSSGTDRVPDALLERFDYSEANDYIVMNPDFFEIMEENMRDAQPCELGIWGTSGGHAVVADGFLDSGDFHLNMGWSGYANGWYSLPEGMPEGFSIVGHQAADIIPPVITRRPPWGLAGEQGSSTGIDLTWNEPLHITEPVVNYKIYRKDLYDPAFSFIGTSTTREFHDTDVEELTMYIYGVSAYYGSDGESGLDQTTVYSGVDNGWSTVYGGSGEQIAYSVAPTEDNGCIAVGYYSWPLCDKDLYINKNTASGRRLVRKTIGGNSDDVGYSIIQTSDGGFLAVGYTESYGMGGKDIYMVKTDSECNTSWTKNYGGTMDDCALGVIQTSDGGYAITGYYDADTVGNLFLMKTDSNGNEEWTEFYLNHARGKAITQSADGYIITGYLADGELGREDIVLLKTNFEGDSLWLKTYGGTYSDIGTSLLETDEDSEILVASTSMSFGIPIFTSIYIMKTDSEGDTIWTRTKGGMGDYTANSIDMKLNGNLLITGSIEQSGEIDLYLYETDYSGDSIDAKIYSTLGTDIGYQAIQLADTGVVIAGKTTMNGDNDFWILKIGGDLYTQIDESGTLPQSKEIYAYPNPFNSSVNIVTPNGSSVSIFDINGRKIADISPSNSIASMHRWYPQEGTPSGIYLARIKNSNREQVKLLTYIK